MCIEFQPCKEVLVLWQSHSPLNQLGAAERSNPSCFFGWQEPTGKTVRVFSVCTAKVGNQKVSEGFVGHVVPVGYRSVRADVPISSKSQNRVSDGGISKIFPVKSPVPVAWFDECEKARGFLRILGLWTLDQCVTPSGSYRLHGILKRNF